MYGLANSSIEKIDIQLLENKGINCYIKRDDLIHPEVAGNKWRKLKYNLLEAKTRNKSTILTFGGAYSNHIYAVAAAAEMNGFKSIGLIRGEEPKKYGHTLQFAVSKGMKLIFLSREAYRKKTIPNNLMKGDFYLIPEGGTNSFAIKGCAEIVDEVKEQLPEVDFDYWCTSCGTGGTIAGLITGLKGESQVLGFSALKGNFLEKEIRNHLSNHPKKETNNWKLITDFHFGGYAKHKKELIEFINEFKTTTKIALDPVYTGKMIYGIKEMIANDYFPKGTNLLILHTGGLQGNIGFNQRFGNLLK